MKKWFEKWQAEKAKRKEKTLPAVVDYRDITYVRLSSRAPLSPGLTRGVLAEIAVVMTSAALLSVNPVLPFLDTSNTNETTWRSHPEHPFAKCGPCRAHINL